MQELSCSSPVKYVKQTFKIKQYLFNKRNLRAALFIISKDAILFFTTMGNETTVYLSREKLDELAKELEYLKKEKRKEIAQSLEFAKSLGDLSENAEYIQAREDQAKTEERISQLEETLKNAVVVKKHHSSTIEVGTTIVVEKAGSGSKLKYQNIFS